MFDEKVFCFYRFIFIKYFLVSGYPTYNYDILENECVENVHHNFQKTKMKIPKITVNERLMGFYGFEKSAHAVIILDVSNTDVQPPKMNLSFINLIMLHASNNGLRKIDEIGNDTFPSLKFLNLSSNAISKISQHVFSHLSEVEVLDLSFNCFVHFSYNRVFLSHENLKRIYLQNNILHTINGMHNINQILHLDFFDLSYNFIDTIDTFNLNVKNLKINNNELKSLTIHYAEEMICDASVNHLSSFISTGTFMHLNLSKNEFTSFTGIEIQSVNNLILSRNKMTSYVFSVSSEEDIENEGIHTKTLDLSYNLLTSMDDLKMFKKVESINLEGNHMQNLDFEKIRQDFPNVKKINLINNRLNDVDLNEAKFHNDTRFLKIQFDYMAQETITLIPPLNLLLPTLQSNIFETTTKEQNLITESNSDDDKVLSQFPLFIYLVIFALFMTSILILIFVIYNRHTTFRFMSRIYNEAENPL